LKSRLRTLMTDFVTSEKEDNDVIARYGTYIYSDLNTIIFTNNFL